MSKKDAKFLGTFYITVSVRMRSIFKSNFMESRILAFTGWSTLIQDISNLESRINILQLPYSKRSNVRGNIIL